MNKRIKELAVQAGGNPNYKACRYFFPPPPNYIDPATVDLEKFAELIVKECCDIFVELRTRPADLAVKDVKKHFGVD